MLWSTLFKALGKEYLSPPGYILEENMRYVCNSRRSLSPAGREDCKQQIPVKLFVQGPVLMTSGNTTLIHPSPSSHPPLLPCCTNLLKTYLINVCLCTQNWTYTHVRLVNFKPRSTCGNRTGHAWSVLPRDCQSLNQRSHMREGKKKQKKRTTVIVTCLI